MLSVIEAERYFEEKSCKSDPQQSTSVKNKVKRRVCEEDQSYIASGNSHQVGYRDIHSKQSSKNVSRNKDEHHHPRHQTQPCSSLSNENLLHSTKDKLDMESDSCPKKDLNRRYRKKKLQVSDCNVVDSMDSGENERPDCDSESGFAFNNICNNSNGGISCWDELRKSICPEEAKIVPSAAFLEHDIISKQRKEMMLLMEELSTRDQELNDLVRSHQSQVKAWETDRNKLKELQEGLFNYEKELQRSDQHLQLTLDEMKKVTDQKEIDGMELKKTKGEMEKLSKKIQENSFYLKEMEVQNKNLMDSVKKLVNAKEDLEMRGKDLSSRLKSKAGELNAQASEITRLTAQNNSLESKLANVNENIRNLKAESVAWKNRYCSAKDEMDRLTEENTLKDGHIQNLTTQLHETLQQTLALQKALFTSCEREKCKEEIMHSLRKQQKRSMQEMSSLRKLYERQTKDMTLYHLSVQSSGNCHAGQGEVKEDVEQGTDKKPHGQSGQGEGKISKKSQDQAQTHASGRGRHTERKHKNDGWSNKNMSYNTHKPNFLRHESREESSFLLKKKICCSDGQSSQESDYDERKDFIYSVNSEYEESDAGNKDRPCDVSLRGDKTEKENGNDTMDKKEKDNEGVEIMEISSSRSRNVCRQNVKMEKSKRRSKSLGVEDNGKLLNNSAHHRHKSCSRGTSPLNIQDRATSPITNFYTAHENTASLYSDINTLSDDKNNGKNTSKNMETVQNENNMEDTKRVDGEYKESYKKDNDRTLWSAVKRKQHNETSGVCLSSSDCSSSSILSSPGRERAFDELTPADSDGMCNELQRKYIPDPHEPSHSFHDGLDPKSACIHLRNSPTVIPDPQNNSSKMNTRSFSNQRDSENTSPKRNMFVGRSYRLVDEKQNEDATINKEKWSDSSEIINSGIGMCSGIDKMKNGTGSYTLHRNDHRIDLSGVHNDSYTVNRRNFEVRNPQVSNLKEYDHKIPCENNNGHKIVKGPSENNDSNRVNGTGTIFFSKNLTDNNSRFQQSRHSSIHFSNSAREKESLGMDNQASILDKKRLASTGRCVRIVSPQQDVINKRNALSDFMRKETNNHMNTHSDSSPFDSDQSEMSLFSVSTKSNRSSIKEKLNNIFARSAVAKSVDSSRNRPHSPQQKEDADSKVTEDNKGGTKFSSVDTKQNYFYEENLSSDSDHGRLRTRNRTCENKIVNNAYIVPVSSSTCSRPYMSSKCPSLYNHLSNIHFSEKSGRFEWTTQGSSREANGKEKHQGSYQHGKPPFITFPNSETIDKHTESDKDALRGNCSNNNNSNCQLFGEEDAMIDDIFEHSSPDASNAVIHSLNPNTNMDKFHHHYNNIVRKLTSSNSIIDMDDNLENSIDTHQNNFPFNPFAPKKVTKNTEFSNIKSDESIFSPSQICVKDSYSENRYVVDDNIVRKLDFSNSTCVDQSHSETVSICTSHFCNLLEFNSEDKSVVKPEDDNSRKMNIPLEGPQIINDYPYLHSTRHTAYLHDMDSGFKHLNETSEANEDIRNASFPSNNEPFWNVCDHDEQTKFDKDKILLPVDAKCITRENNNNLLLDKQQEHGGDFEFVARLPDYFPDISSVMADDDSVNVDEGERTDCTEFNEFICKNPGVKTGETQTDDGYMTHELISKQPYSHTSTPTKVKIMSSVINCHSTNDLNLPYRYKDVQSGEEKTLISKESDFFCVECLSGNEVDAEHSNDTISSAFEDDGDGRKKDIDHAHVYKYKAEKDIRHIIDSNSIIITLKETEDTNKSDIFSIRQNKSCDRLCSPKNKIDEYNDECVITKDGTKSTPLKINCDEDIIRLKEDDSSFLEGPWDKFEDRLSNFLSDTPRQETDDHLTVMPVPMSPASKLHHLLLESQEMLRSLEKRTPFLK